MLIWREIGPNCDASGHVSSNMTNQLRRNILFDFYGVTRLKTLPYEGEAA